MHHKIVPQECPTKLCHKSAAQDSFVRDTPVGNFGGTALWGSLVAQYCGTAFWETLVAQCCGTAFGALLWDTLVGHACGALLSHSLVHMFPQLVASWTTNNKTVHG